MKEILNIVAEFLIRAIFAASLVFFGLVFWHWRNDGKQRDVRRENSLNPVANGRAFGR